MSLMRCDAPAPTPVTVWTIGHSTRPWDEFLRLLFAQGISAIADVRRFGIASSPLVRIEQMAKTLPAHGVEYLWIPELGGRRKVQPDSPNGAWDNAAFQGYADHMATAEFAGGLSKVLALGANIGPR